MKRKILDFLFSLFNFHNHVTNSKRMFFDNESAIHKLWKRTYRRNIGIFNYSGQKDIINYITSRNMRKTITPSNNKSVLAQPEMTSLNIKYIIHVISKNLKKSKQLFYLPSPLNFLNFHTRSFLLGNLISRESKTNISEHHEELPEHWGGPDSFKLIILIKENFDEVINSNSSILVFFYAYWCPHCLRLKIPFGKAALLAKEAKLDMVFAAFDVTTNPDLADEKGVVGIPTIKYYRNGKFAATYRGKRTTEDLMDFVKNPPSPSGDHKLPDI